MSPGHSARASALPWQVPRGCNSARKTGREQPTGSQNLGASIVHASHGVSVPAGRLGAGISTQVLKYSVAKKSVI